MKRCPECRRDFYDDSLLYCLDDGNALLEGPTSADESATAILSGAALLGGPAGERPTQIIEVERMKPPEGGTPSATAGSSDSSAATSRSFGKRLLAAPLLLAIILGGLSAYRYFSSASSNQIESIAVIPFVNESGNADVEYLTDGMTETLITSLSNIPNLAVKARSTVFYYKGKETSPKKIGEELSVQAVLLGLYSGLRLLFKGNVRRGKRCVSEIT